MGGESCRDKEKIRWEKKSQVIIVEEEYQRRNISREKGNASVKRSV